MNKAGNQSQGALHSVYAIDLHETNRFNVIHD